LNEEKKECTLANQASVYTVMDWDGTRERSVDIYLLFCKRQLGMVIGQSEQTCRISVHK